MARAELPACIEDCLPAAVGATRCPSTNATCICDSQAFYESLLPCVLINCGYADVSGLLSYGLEFCKITGVNSAQRLSIGFGKSASGGGDGDDDASVSTSSPAAPVEPTPAPEPEAISSADPIPIVASSMSTSVTEIPPIVGNTPTVEPAPQTETPIPAPVELATRVVVSITTPTEVAETTSSVPELSVSSTQVESPESLEVEPASSSASTPTARSRTLSGLFTVESSSSVDDSNTELVVIQTTDPTPKNTMPPVTTAPESTSAPPTPTADEPSSASASPLHMFGQSSFNSFILCLFALLFFF